MAQERVDSTFDLPLHSIREICEIRGQKPFSRPAQRSNSP